MPCLRPALRATIRLQFRQGLTLDHAVELVPYFARLGISHIYASPLLTATPGSPHGYDVLDCHHIDPTLGGEAALRRLAHTLHEHDMGLILDIVPNHMAVGGAGNIWWENLLAWGQNSPYAEFFDIAWDDPDPQLAGRVLLPFLDRPFEAALVSGALNLKHDRESGLFFIHHHDHRFPISPAHYSSLLKGMDLPHALSAALTVMAERSTPDRDCAQTLKALSLWLNTAIGADVLSALTMRFNPAHQPGREQLRHLIDRQNWVCAWWRTASELLNWRRFFDNTSLGAICVEREKVFTDTHHYVLSLLDEGIIDGLRIDHIDGLAAPAAYCRRLRQRMFPSEQSSSGPVSIHVEKILAPGENLPAEWDVDGTTGYDFMEQVSLLLHDANGKDVLDALWQDTRSDVPNTMEETERQARDEILHVLFPAECERLTRLLHASFASLSCETTPSAIKTVLTVLLRHFPRYRCYYADDLPMDHTADRAALSQAVIAARKEIPSFHHLLLQRMSALLTTPVETGPSPAVRRIQRAFEHLTAPLTAKSLEDTAFYRNVRLPSRNEVGSAPDTLALPVAAFHEACQKRHATHPHSLLATATHDHKRGEDSRMRIAILSEMPEQWHALVTSWLEKHTSNHAPDRVDALMLYQSLLGAWPVQDYPNEEFGPRMADWLTKALREGKRHTSWLDPNESYESACQDYLAHLLDTSSSLDFQRDMTRFVRQIAPAAALNSLSQTLLRLTAPGVPDLYQGCELWDFSLVDPDNRRPVDFKSRSELLQAASDIDHAAATWPDGAIKLQLIARLLTFRAQHPNLFRDGSYHPISLNTQHIVAFLRTLGNQRLLVMAPRHTHTLAPDPATLALTQPPAPFTLPVKCHGQWRSLLRERSLDIGSHPIWPFETGMVPLDCLVWET
ncbi:malto-oligosyltrehalose synthase [Acetobacter estunensis]|uniref:malto-oligosyltrehalose synthase n=1 Tax=Acetobacter estunensis TaxID=104097 RepID=UPI001C2DCCF9|nr:malto-oligosyltrehalose synthase [Acetobacter estunensis]MBV1835800.1 malto-oligosyltrehalose synthase [Acetobacter estunensis]MBV1835939.1 malto-oligosyltrehalose synthase [Acetobacter estunensis]